MNVHNQNSVDLVATAGEEVGGTVGFRRRVREGNKSVGRKWTCSLASRYKFENVIILEICKTASIHASLIPSPCGDNGHGPETLPLPPKHADTNHRLYRHVKLRGWPFPFEQIQRPRIALTWIYERQSLDYIIYWVFVFCLQLFIIRYYRDLLMLTNTNLYLLNK